MSDSDGQDFEDESSDGEASSGDDYLRSILKFATRGNIYFLVESSRFRKIPEPVRAKSATKGATEEMLSMLGIGMNGFSSTSYAFSTDDHALYGKATLLKEAPEGRSPKFLKVMCNVTRFLVYAQTAKQKKIIIDYGTKPIELFEGQIAHAERLALISRIATLPNIFVLQTKSGEGMTMEVDGLEYAIAFLYKEDSVAAIDGIKEESPGVRLGTAVPKSFTSSILQSDLAGILFNPASNSQTIISRSELEMLELACEIAPPPESKIGKVMKGLFTLMKMG